MNFIRDWFKSHFNDPQIIILAVLLVGGTAVILKISGGIPS